MGKRRRNGGWVVMLTLTGALAVVPACAAKPGLAPEAPADPGDGSEPPPSQPVSLATVEAAHAELDRAASELDLALSGLGAGGPRSYATPPGDDPSAQPDAPPDELDVAEEPGKAQPHAAGRGCSVACRALASMRRAASRLCALTHADDPRCVRAERRLARASGQVQRACPRCRD